jgi:hypothetical protein
VVVDAGFDTAIVYEQCARRGWTASHGIGPRWILPHGPTAGACGSLFPRSRRRSLAPTTCDAFYFFFSNEGIKDKLAALRQPGAMPKWEVPTRCVDDYRKHMLAK